MNGFEITMTLDEVTPLTQRQLIIPGDITFKNLHEIISLVFNLSANNKYKFVFDDLNIEIMNTTRLNRDIVDSRYEKIDKYLEAYEKLVYINDFWNISIEVHETVYDKKYPLLVSYKGFYNPLSEIKSVNEFSQLLELKKNIDEAKDDERKIISNFHRINKLKLQKNLMSLFNVPYKVNNHRIIEINKENTLDDLL